MTTLATAIKASIKAAQEQGLTVSKFTVNAQTGEICVETGGEKSEASAKPVPLSKLDWSAA